MHLLKSQFHKFVCCWIYFFLSQHISLLMEFFQRSYFLHYLQSIPTTHNDGTSEFLLYSNYPTSVIHLPLNNNKPSSLMSINASSGNKMPCDELPSPNGSTVCSSGAGGGVPLKKRRKRTN
ncbi:unnamed protein product, partial [Brugia timori]|uniref:Uncharacterized protein n=1 Tax=Brugia timori TaxID=42155 RepID=A0A0R3R8H5_9BILA